MYCKSRSGALQIVLWQCHRRSNTFVIKPSGYEFSRFDKYWSSFLHSCVFCATIYNKSWVLPCSASVETSIKFLAAPLPWVYTNYVWVLKLISQYSVFRTTLLSIMKYKQDALLVYHKRKFCLHKALKTPMLAIPATKTVEFYVCLLEKRTQCRKLNSFNKLLLSDYLQLRIAFLQLRGCSGAKHEMGGKAPLAMTMKCIRFVLTRLPIYHTFH